MLLGVKWESYFVGRIKTNATGTKDCGNLLIK